MPPAPLDPDPGPDPDAAPQAPEGRAPEEQRSEERRRHERRALGAEGPGLFRLELPGRSLPLERVRDVSVSGCGVEAPEPLPVDGEVRLSFRTPDLALVVRARVMWCEPAPDGGRSGADGGAYWAGLRFEAADPHHGVLMFMALRRWLDDFA